MPIQASRPSEPNTDVTMGVLKVSTTTIEGVATISRDENVHPEGQQPPLPTENMASLRSRNGMKVLTSLNSNFFEASSFRSQSMAALTDHLSEYDSQR